MLKVDLPYCRARLSAVRCQEPILEIGAGWDLEFHRVPFREHGYRLFFSHELRPCDGITFDFLGDICDRTDIPDSFAGTCLVFSVLEHVHSPWQAADEIWRIMKTDGLLLGSVPLRTAIHRHDRDYWRFCPDGLAHLLRRFRLLHLAVDGNVGLPANLLFTATKDESSTDWSDHNQDTVLRPQVILGSDYVTSSAWKIRIVDLLRRRLGLSIEKWDGPWNAERMKELGYQEWTVVNYPVWRDE